MVLHRSLHDRSRWTCRCDCGNTTIATSGYELKVGLAKSCGCLRRERFVASNRTHDLSKSPEFWAWVQAKRRCTYPKHPKYPQYGGRGIRMCDRWLNDFAAFYADLGPRPAGHSLDRIDNDGHYEPGNVRWAEPRTQQNNMRSNVRLRFQGHNRTIAEWARALKLHPHTLRERLQRGWPLDRALKP